MAQTDDLHRLIKSLTPSEKRYMKVMAGKDSDSAMYLRLMDAMDAQAEYDESALIAKNAKEEFVKYLARERNRLFNTILKAMRGFHAELSVDNQLHDLLQDEVFLRSKGLVAQRKKVLAKAKELALRHDKLVVLYQILEREYALVLESTPKDLVDECHALLDAKEQTMAQLTELHRVTVAKEEAFLALRSGMDFKKESNVQYMDELLQRSRVQDPTQALTKLSRLQAHSLRALYYRSKGDFAAAKDEYGASHPASNQGKRAVKSANWSPSMLAHTLARSSMVSSAMVYALLAAISVLHIDQFATKIGQLIRMMSQGVCLVM